MNPQDRLRAGPDSPAPSASRDPHEPGFIELGPARACVLGRTALAELAGKPRSENVRRAESREAAASLGIAPERLFFLRQVHGVHCEERSLADAARAVELDAVEGDALFSGDAGVGLGVRTADCLPFFFCFYAGSDPASVGTPSEESAPLGPEPTDSVGTPTGDPGQTSRRPPAIAGIVHAGWRGMRAGIIEQSLRRALQALGPKAEDWRCVWAIGPAIGGEVYEVGPEVAKEFLHVRPRTGPGRGDDRWLLDLSAEAAERAEQELASLARARGLAESDAQARMCRSRALEGCTYTQNDRWFSHRRGDAGRNLNLILLP